MQQFQFHFGYHKLYTVDPCGTSGGLALFNNNDFNVNILFSNNRVIVIQADIQGTIVYLSFVYGDTIPKFRDQVWERLTRIGTMRFDPWFIIGDLNEISGNHEKRGGKLRHANTFSSFNLMLRDCGMLDFPCLGNQLSWRGRRAPK